MLKKYTHYVVGLFVVFGFLLAAFGILALVAANAPSEPSAEEPATFTQADETPEDRAYIERLSFFIEAMRVDTGDFKTWEYHAALAEDPNLLYDSSFMARYEQAAIDFMDIAGADVERTEVPTSVELMDVEALHYGFHEYSFAYLEEVVNVIEGDTSAIERATNEVDGMGKQMTALSEEFGAVTDSE